MDGSVWLAIGILGAMAAVVVWTFLLLDQP